MKVLCIVISVFSITQVLAQDSHYSLYHFRNGSLNPALTGYQNENGGLRTLYRTQWNGLTPFSYLNFEIDKQEKQWGYGLMWDKNGAGPGSLISNQINIGASRAIQITQASSLRMGLQAGYFRSSLDWASATFESQYNADGTLSSENLETLTTQRTSAIDVNAGLFYTASSEKSTLNAGLALNHLAGSNLSLYTDGLATLHTRSTFHAEIFMNQRNDWQIGPQVLYQRQAKASESLLAIKAQKEFADNRKYFLSAGIRLKDALIFSTGVTLDNLDILIAYDFNISKIGRVTNGFGAFEIGLGYRFNNNKGYEETVNLRILDTDEDGVADTADHCPEIPGSISNNGCPGRKDTDGDGILDDVDLCPGIAGSSIHGGCPDSDGDGVADIDDECPALYGALHFQGCPDTDQDGISDKYDACPATFGSTKNKGCPDTKRVQATPHLGEYVVTHNDTKKQEPEVLSVTPRPTFHKHSYTSSQTEKEPVSGGSVSSFSPAKTAVDNGEIMERLVIYFDSDQSTLDLSSKKLIRDFIQNIELNSRVKFVLKGHTDENGTDVYNMELGFRRAAATKRYMEQFTENTSDILTLSYGEELPASVIQSEQSNAKNRRVEIAVVR